MMNTANMAKRIKNGAKVLLETDRECCFGDHQVYISALLDLPGLKGITKADLVELHRRGEITLVRADLVGVMPPALVAASETTHGEARYHFIAMH
jgi:hypothetical protein